MQRREFLTAAGSVGAAVSGVSRGDAGVPVGARTVAGEITDTPGTISLRWDRTYGDDGDRSLLGVTPTSDDGFLAVGQAVTSGDRHPDAWLLKVDDGGETVWSETYGGGLTDWVSDAVETSDGYVVAGQTESSGSGGLDAWLLQTDADGNEQWRSTYGGSADDRALAVLPAIDGGYLFAGGTRSAGSGGVDAWLMRVDSGGDADWNSVYGGGGDDWLFDAAVDGNGYLFVGQTDSAGAGGTDAWALRTGADGDATWNQTYGESGDDYARSVAPALDDGFVVAGGTVDGGATDAMLVGIDGEGTERWRRTYGGDANDRAVGVVPSNGGDGYLVTGASESNGGDDVSTWTLLVDEDGRRVDSAVDDSDRPNYANAVTRTGDGFVVAGDSGGSSESDGRLVRYDEYRSELDRVRGEHRQLADWLDERTETPPTAFGHRDRVDAAHADLVDAMDRGRLSEDDVIEAVERLQLGDGVARSVVEHLGPEPEGRQDTYNLTRRMSRPILSFALELLMWVTGFGAKAAKALGIGGKVAAEAAGTAIESAVGRLFDHTLGNDEETKEEAKRQTSNQADSLTERLISGAISTYDALSEAFEGALEFLVDTVAAGLRTFSETDIASAWAPPGTTVGAADQAAGSLDGGLSFLYEELLGRVDRGGLDGSFGAAERAAETANDAISGTTDTAVSAIESAEATADEYDLIDQLIDLYQFDQDSVTEYIVDRLEVQIALAFEIAGVVVDAFNILVGTAGLIKINVDHHLAQYRIAAGRIE